MPPMLGKNRPESFTPASRSKNDSMRSPTTAETLKIIPNTAWSGVIPARQSPNSAANRTFATGHFESEKPQQKRVSQIKGLHYIGSGDWSTCWVVILGRGCSGNTNRNRSISKRCSADGSV